MGSSFTFSQASLPVHGPPLRTGSVDYLRTGPRTTPTDPSTDQPKNNLKKIRNIKYFTYCLFRLLLHGNRSLVSKFRALRWENLTDLSSASGKSCITDIPRCHFPFAVARSICERPGNLREIRNLRYFECISFAMLFSLFSHGFVNSPQASQFATRNFKYKQNGDGREITNFLGFPVFHAKPQQRKGHRCNDLQ